MATNLHWAEPEILVTQYTLTTRDSARYPMCDIMCKDNVTTRIRGRCIVIALILIMLLGCSSEDSSISVMKTPFIEAGDLAEIEQSGILRILFPRRTSSSLPRQGYSLDYEIELAEKFAIGHDLKPIRVFVESREDLLPALLDGKGDLIAANLTVTESRSEHVNFTVPVAIVREIIVTRVADPEILTSADLVGRRVAVRRSSSFMETITALQQHYPGIEIEDVPETIDTEEIIEHVAKGRYDLTISDSNLLATTLAYRDDVRPALELSGDRAIAWAVRPDSHELLASLNRYLTKAKLLQPGALTHTDDMTDIAERRVLRVLTRNSASTYFLWKGQLQGFEYDLAHAFAEREGLRLEVIVPPDGEDLLSWLVEGKGDLIAAAITPTEERRKQDVLFSRPYNYVSQVVVTRALDTELDSIEDLHGRRFHVRRSSSYWETLKTLQASGVHFDLVAVPEDIETEEILARVATHEYDLTLADSHIVGIEMTWREDLRNAFPIGATVPHAWAVRSTNPQLLDAINQFINLEYKGLFYNVKHTQYFKNEARIRAVGRYAGSATLFSPYDTIVKKYAEQYDFDWRLIVSQMYQESKFDPTARSRAGAAGLMQILPRTAEELGFTDLHDPEVGIQAGLMYMDWLRDRFDPQLAVTDRMWFILASYNAGPGHVRDARRLATRQGLDPNRWFGNVEQAMLLLSRRQYAQEALHGYCRGSEPVNYVSEIRQRYRAYADTSGNLSR